MDVENPSQLFALYLVTLNISWILTHLSLEANGVKHNDVASERFVRITQNTADRASCAAYANFCSENTYVDTVLASVFGMGRRICELEALPPGRKPFNCPTDPAFTQIAKKYRGMEDVWPAVSQDKFLFDAINTYLIYSFMPSDNAKFVEEKIVRALTTSRALASFYMAVQCLKLCVSTEAAQQAVVFSLLVGELLSHCAGRLALLAYARASGIIIQEEVAGLGIRTCKTRGTNKLSWLIASGYAEIWLSLLGTIGCLEEYVVSGFALLTARGKESSSYLNAVMKSFPFIASDGNDAADLETLNLLEVNSFIDFCISLHREHSVQGEVQFCKNYHTRLVQGYAVEREGES